MEFYVVINDKEQGPFTMEQLAAMRITPETEVWTQGMPEWKQAGDVPALTTLLQQLEYERNTAPATPPARTTEPRRKTEQYEPWTQPREPQYEPQYEPQPQPKEPERRKGGCLKWSLLMLVILIVAMVLTVPSREDHLDAINEVTHEWMNDALGQNGLEGSILGEMAKWIGGSGTDFIVDQLFTCDNYIVCSVGKFGVAGQSRRVSFGILGHVFTFDKDDINRTIKKSLQGDDSEQAADEPSLGILPPADETDPAPDDEPQLNDTTSSSSNPAQEIFDTITSRAKREAIRAAKEWAKKKIDEM